MAARLQVMLDLPTPPFWLKTTLRMLCLAYGSLGISVRYAISVSFRRIEGRQWRAVGPGLAPLAGPGEELDDGPLVRGAGPLAIEVAVEIGEVAGQCLFARYANHFIQGFQLAVAGVNPRPVEDRLAKRRELAPGAIPHPVEGGLFRVGEAVVAGLVDLLRCAPPLPPPEGAAERGDDRPGGIGAHQPPQPGGAWVGARGFCR